jgi:hypothetical protein
MSYLFGSCESLEFAVLMGVVTVTECGRLLQPETDTFRVLSLSL